MKKLILLILVTSSISFLVGCNDELSENIKYLDIFPNTDTSPFYRSYESAQAIAMGSLDTCTPGTRTAPRRTVREHYLYTPSISTRSSETELACFHVINFSDDQGFAIVSADKRATPVYAISDTGNIDLTGVMQETGIGVFMDCAVRYYRKEIEQLGDRPLPPWTDPGDSAFIDLMMQTPVIIDGIECVQRQVETIDEEKGPLLNTSWHQKWPFNYFCPTYVDSTGTYKCPAGCGPVAVGQIMAYHKHPSAHGGYNFDWQRIASNSNVPPNDTCKARLVNLVGIHSLAEYGKDGTSTTLTNLRAAFQNMGYALSEKQNNGSLISSDVRANISDSLPMLFTGSRQVDSYGHAWVVDGYRKSILHTTYYHAYYPYPKYKTMSTVKFSIIATSALAVKARFA